MKIETGKYYRARDGKKAFILGFDPFGDRQYLHGCIEHYGVCTWTVSGRFSLIKGDNPRDLVEEWVDPEFFNAKVYLYRKADNLLECNLFDCGGSIGSAKVTITEGEFADESASI